MPSKDDIDRLHAFLPVFTEIDFVPTFPSSDITRESSRLIEIGSTNYHSAGP
jgi:hypothetical protein